ncbi:MAG: sulfate ABC transporter substrate-binding protein [Parvibaculaceae bacterium]|nr:sulfate ABC transporter substrate-binding protein [Parvibaculaceae bacterium]
MNWKTLSLAIGLGLTAIMPAHAAEPTSILNVSYDVSRELFVDLNPVFSKEWQAKTGQAINVEQSHGGSSKQARAILEGLQADVVTFNQVTDVQVLHDKGDLVAADWQKKFPDNASPFYSLPVFLVRKGNPKNIHDWSDLVKPGVQVVFPNPKTSGNGRYTYLAATAYALNKFGGDQAKANQFAKALLANVPVFDTGGRAATTTFANREIGDVLITFEAEAYGVAQEYAKDGYEVVTPPVSLLAEFPVAVVDKVVDQRGSRAVATAYLNFLYSPEAQAIIAKHFYRINDKAVAAKAGQTFPSVKLITVNDVFGGWDKVNKDYLKSGGYLDQVFTGQ